MTGLLQWLRDWLLASRNPRYRRYRRAKQLHENSPHGLFPNGFYGLLTEEQKRAARGDARLNEAVALYKECAQEQAAERYPLNEGIAYHQVGLVCLRQGHAEEAKQAFEQALAILRHLPERSALGSSSSRYFHLAELALEHGDFHLAFEHICNGRDIDVGLGDSLGVRMYDELLAQAKVRESQAHEGKRKEESN